MREQVVYLMFNARNGYMKIGKSFNPSFREKTLQSEEPEIFLFAISKSETERHLHRRYRRFRLRGEWFDLGKGHLAWLLLENNFRLTYEGCCQLRRMYGVLTIERLIAWFATPLTEEEASRG